MEPSRSFDDDFILTLSDQDGLPVSGSEDEDSHSEPPKATLGAKRKRGNETRYLKAKTPKKQKTNGSKKIQPVALIDDESASEPEEQGLHDGAINPDFEFEIGQNASTGILEDFDGWGEEGASRRSRDSKGNKKGVDIDEIIARRAQKNNINGDMATKTLEAEKRLKEGGYEDEDEDEQEGGGGFLNFEDDELLATDGFGAGAESEDDAEEDANKDSDISGDDNQYLANVDKDTDSDADSVASPTAHPDDLESQDSDTDSQTSASDDEETAKRAAFFAPEIKAMPKSSDATTKASGFTSFSLSRPILRALTTLSFTDPTPIQTRTIPLALAGHDLVGSAVTGSGKTASFLLPILERLLYRPRRIPTTRVSILVPTRELAVQCHAVAVQLAKYTDITFALVVGGFSLREQETILRKRPDVVIATPGRYIDHMRNSASFTVENIEILVLDEADRMLEDGFADELDEILKTIPKSRQTMLFSATMTDKVDKLVRVGMTRPVRVSVDKKKATVGGLVQEFVRLRPGRENMRLASLAILCTKIFQERTIVFFRQKREAHRVRIVFGLLGLKAGELHGSMTQEQRIASVEAFRDGRVTHLLATDLASRGLDIKNVMSVINYEAPQSHEIYVHRVGRTARAGREGRACTIAAEPDRKVVKAAVKSARAQGAKVVSRVLEVKEVDAMGVKIQSLEEEIEAVMKEEQEEKQLAQAETHLTRGENIVRHEAEIMARPKRTWFESEKEKRIAKKAGRAELNGPDPGARKGKKGKLSGKDKKRLDDRRERLEGKIWRKGKGSEEAAKAESRERKSDKKKGKDKLSGGKKGKVSKGRRR